MRSNINLIIFVLLAISIFPNESIRTKIRIFQNRRTNFDNRRSTIDNRRNINDNRRNFDNRNNNVHVTDTRIKQRIHIRQDRPWGSGSHNTWNSYGSTGHIYGYLWYIRTPTYHRSRKKEPTICRNVFDNLMDNGTHYKWFICPTQNHTWTHDKCCGVPDHQYCCDLAAYRNFTGTTSSRPSSLTSMIVGPIVGFLLLICCCGICTAKHKKRMMNRTVVNETFVGSIARGQMLNDQPINPAPYPIGQIQLIDNQPTYPGNQSPYPVNQPPFPSNQSPFQPPYPSNQPPYPSNQPPYPSNQPPYPSNQLPYPINQPPYPSNDPPYPINQPPYPIGTQAPLYPANQSQAPIAFPSNQSNLPLPDQPPPYEEVAKVNTPSAPPM